MSDPMVKEYVPDEGKNIELVVVSGLLGNAAPVCLWLDRVDWALMM